MMKYERSFLDSCVHFYVSSVLLRLLLLKLTPLLENEGERFSIHGGKKALWPFGLC